MKRLLLLLLLLALLIGSLQGCIHFTPEPPSGCDPDTSPETDPASPNGTYLPWVDGDTNAEAFLQGGIVDCSEREYSYDEMCEDLRALSARYGAHFSYRSIGRSADGRELYACTLGNPKAENAILVSAGIMKNAAGIYGMLALIAVWIGPFLEIGVQYLLLKLTTAVCSFFGTKAQVKLIQDFSGAMGMLLAMTGTVCLILMISTICFMKGIA